MKHSISYRPITTTLKSFTDESCVHLKYAQDPFFGFLYFYLLWLLMAMLSVHSLYPLSATHSIIRDNYLNSETTLGNRSISCLCHWLPQLLNWNVYVQVVEELFVIDKL